MSRIILGIDAGSVSLSAVLMNEDGEILGSYTGTHEGNIREELVRMREGLAPGSPVLVALTGRAGGRIRHSFSVDSRMACIRSVREGHPDIRSILLVGAEQFSLIRFDREGHYSSIRSNTSCAAGTGSFLDQQAGRLKLSGSAELSSVARKNREEPPLVATRCAVFAKTDLIHAQQEGYSLPAVSDGLCRGLARNLADTLFKEDEVLPPVLFTGGVSANEAVAEHLQDILKIPFVIDPMGQLQGAWGAALSLLDELAASSKGDQFPVLDSGSLYMEEEKDRSGFYPPLTLEYSDYPDFKSYRTWEQPIEGRKGQPFVEVDLYKPLPERLKAYLGIDIGSTSTKAVVCSLDGEVYGGFYTRTSGRPLEAVQALFEAIEKASESEGCRLEIRGSGTTGSGRKFIGKLISADVVLDEISAHARAAAELDPEVDTILEIGGQDAKFTALRNGRVTLSVMNNVCAAGTGSFLEEQASRLGLSVRDYAPMTEGQRGPLVSDRCTVFMERDINHLLSEGCSVPEVLTAALHGVRENYLRKVAVTGSIGKRIFFQGATARNRSLVAAFEQKLGREILVSPFCHLTGALGAALALKDEAVQSASFAGLDLCRQEVPVRQEVCTICGNNCKLTVADLEGRSVAFGFLCGRDYDTEGYVNRNSSGWNLMRERRALESRLRKEFLRDVSSSGPVVGIPDALYLVEDRGWWEIFFRELGIRTITTAGMKDGISKGKPLTGSEFCAPVSSLFGHAHELLERGADYLFLPHYLERKQGKDGERRKFCYFTQFSASLVSQGIDPGKVLSPLGASRYSLFQLKGELYKMLSAKPDLKRGYLQVSAALDRAQEFRRRYEGGLKSLFAEGRSKGPDSMDVVLLGRPYSVLPEGMNKGIPEIFGTQGIRVFYQDMMDFENFDFSSIHGLLKEINWNFGEKILKAAEQVVQTEGLYPVLLTSFKCGPDSFLQDYFRKILEAHDKPYLILELDEHDSAVGYETRIEAAVRAFRNHREEELARSGSDRVRMKDYRGINPRYARKFDRRRTLVLPNWDDYAIPLMADLFRSQGFKAVVMDETDRSIRRSLRWNTGMCIPMNAVVEGFAETLKKHSIKPEHAQLWIPEAHFSCNIKMFPHQIQEIFKVYGEGLEKAKVYPGIIAFSDISPFLPIAAYQVYMFSGLIRRISCRIRPYEHVKGQTDEAVRRSLELLSDLFSGRKKNTGQTVQEIINLFEWISYDKEARKPLVALFGDVYVRENPVFNQNVISYIEENGGEVVTMPYHEYTRMTAEMYFKRWGKELKLKNLISLKPMLTAMEQMERWYYRSFEKVLHQPLFRYSEDPSKILEPFHILLDHEGESQDNLLKTWYISRQYPELTLFVQLNPGFCCAGNVTEAMSSRIQEETGVPVLSLTYDGTGGFKNDAILPYLKYSAAGQAAGTASGGSALPG